MIELGIPCGPNSYEFLETLLKSSQETAKDVSWVVFLDPTADKKYFSPIVKRYKKICKIVICPIFENTKALLGDAFGNIRYAGIRHACILNEMIKELKTDIAGFFDVDVIFLNPDWDLKMISTLNEKTIVIGSEPHSNDSWRGFPNPMAMIFDRKKFIELGIDFQKDQGRGICENLYYTVTEENQYLWKREIGTQIYKEIGHLVIENVINSGYSGVAMRPDNIDDFYFYVIPGEEKPLFTHMGSSRISNNVSDRFKAWMLAIEKVKNIPTDPISPV